jgi:hypothetical protein
MAAEQEWSISIDFQNQELGISSSLAQVYQHETITLLCS